MKNNINKIKYLISAIVALSILFSPFSFAKSSFSSGGGRSSSSFSSGSSSSGRSSFSGGSSKSSGSAAAPAKSSWGSSGNKTGKSSSTDNTISQKSSMSSSSRVTRDQAVANYKAQNASKYTTRFSSEPTTRPSYIPTDHYGPDRTYHYIYYNSGYGGYGYWDMMGTFILYDALTENANRYADSTVVYNNGGHGLAIFLTIFFVIALAIFIIAVANNRTTIYRGYRY